MLKESGVAVLRGVCMRRDGGSWLAGALVGILGRETNLPMIRSIRKAGLSQSCNFHILLLRVECEGCVGGFLTA